jgi:hypothetical protein
MTGWRRGRSNPYTIYQVDERDDLSPEADAELNCVGFFRHPTDAERAVAAVNILDQVGDNDALRELTSRYNALLVAAESLAQEVRGVSDDNILTEQARNLLALIPNAAVDKERMQAVERVRAFVRYLDSGDAPHQSVVWAPNEGVTLRLSDLRALLAIVPE